MDDQKPTPESQQNEPNDKPELTNKYKLRGFQKISLPEYEARRAKDAKRFKFKIPTAVKLIGRSIFFVLFCFGVVYIPWVLFIVATHPIGWSSNNSNATLERKNSTP